MLRYIWSEFTPIAFLKLDWLAGLFSFEELKDPSTVQREHGYQNAVEIEKDIITSTVRSLRWTSVLLNVEPPTFLLVLLSLRR